MSRFSQNYPQLMNQAVKAGYGTEALEKLYQSFSIALCMSNGFYRAQGVPLINHLVSTASIILSENQSADLVQAALLHAAFTLHRFDDSGVSRKLDHRRIELRAKVGSSIEELLWEYEKFPWYSRDVLESYFDNLDSLDRRCRELLTLRLANELDDQLDRAMSYTALGRTGMRSQENLSFCYRLSTRLRLNIMASEFEQVLKVSDESVADPIPGLQWKRKQGYEMTDRLWRMSTLEKTGRWLRQLVNRVK